MANRARSLMVEQSPDVKTKKTQRRIRRARITRGEKCLMALMFIATIVLCIFVVTNYANIYAKEQEIVQLEQHIAEQQQINENLQMKVAELSAPERIMYYAKEELGMSLNDEQVRIIQEKAPKENVQE